MSEINKSLTKTVSAPVNVSITADLKWILSVTEPTLPAGYVRASELDINLGIAGKFWAYIKTT